MGAPTVFAAPAPFKGYGIDTVFNMSLSNTVYTFFNLSAGAFDTDSFWSAGNPTRLTIPAGVNKIRLSGSVYINSSTAQLRARVYKNGGTIQQYIYGAYNVNMRNIPIDTGILEVAEGDYFELSLYQSSGAAATVYIPTLTLEVIE
ncbi:MAG: hypothetical protein KDJ15_07960 [Alphaproteobacteria bacterium]|nr:hypothetical protein [Alphaproteobacteria bacterium]